MSTVFPKWTNKLPTLMLGGVLGTLALVIGVVWYYFTPAYWRVGYMPSQPHVSEQMRAHLQATADSEQRAPSIPGRTFAGFSHQIHAGKLGMDCRYCHSHVEESAEANIPSVSTCIGCHAEGHVNDQMFAKKDRIQFVRDAWAENRSIEWRRIHKVPDYVRNFPHHLHINAGVSCFSCHGNIMEQPIVHQVQSLSMSWCLTCHADPTTPLVPKDKVTDLYWVREQTQARGNQQYTAQTGVALDASSPGGAALLHQISEKPLHLLPQNCGACHY